jgi:hypothetical protein
MDEKRLLARAVVQARALLEEALKDTGRWPLAELHQLFEAVAAYTDATAGDEMIHRCVAGCLSGLHEYLADQGKRVPPDTVHEARCLEVLLFENFDLPAEDHIDHRLDAHDGEDEEDGQDGESQEDGQDEDEGTNDEEPEEDEGGEDDTSHDAESDEGEEDDTSHDAESDEGEEDDTSHDAEGDDGRARRDDDESR